MTDLPARIDHLIRLAYWYCTDFMVNLAARWHISYNEANTRILLLLIPGVVGLLLVMRLIQWVQLRKLRRSLPSTSF
ncbi:hypothetical protein KBK19_07340 [Microvirga sp. STR05]|uniref:Uncharacterized protein n=1 Tax=Hymenobacter duratus TaxID=2771356 RepID=A0ABR8JDC9_9BACT|nr:hypothetical protein [Hymenobacter duratus]MBD2714844.1 hypothetical protein [Hymenobacter duratus]MBR7949749.1 hypothetical protein [Microvirga sp. STR05]